MKAIRIFLLFLPPLLFGQVEELITEIVAKWPHDPSAFTQGLMIVGDMLYESTGLYGESALRSLDLKTGKLAGIAKIPPSYFAEGVAAVGDELILLTWKEEVAFIYDRRTLRLLRELPYEGEAWGLCFDGAYLWMSNGTTFLSKRDPKTLAHLAYLPISLEGLEVPRINALACIENKIYANIWRQEKIICIDKESGKVTATIDASKLWPVMKHPDEVLNGIAYHPKRKTFFLTGKRWPWLFEVRFVKKPQD